MAFLILWSHGYAGAACLARDRRVPAAAAALCSSRNSIEHSDYAKSLELISDLSR